MVHHFISWILVCAHVFLPCLCHFIVTLYQHTNFMCHKWIYIALCNDLKPWGEEGRQHVWFIETQLMSELMLLLTCLCHLTLHPLRAVAQLSCFIINSVTFRSSIIQHFFEAMHYLILRTVSCCHYQHILYVDAAKVFSLLNVDYIFQY
jgi:hypothetical protein